MCKKISKCGKRDLKTKKLDVSYDVGSIVGSIWGWFLLLFRWKIGARIDLGFGCGRRRLRDGKVVILVLVDQENH